RNDSSYHQKPSKHWRLLLSRSLALLAFCMPLTRLAQPSRRIRESLSREAKPGRLHSRPLNRATRHLQAATRLTRANPPARRYITQTKEILRRKLPSLLLSSLQNRQASRRHHQQTMRRHRSTIRATTLNPKRSPT